MKKTHFCQIWSSFVFVPVLGTIATFSTYSNHLDQPKNVNLQAQILSFENANQWIQAPETTGVSLDFFLRISRELVVKQGQNPQNIKIRLNKFGFSIQPEVEKINLLATPKVFFSDDQKQVKDIRLTLNVFLTHQDDPILSELTLSSQIFKPVIGVPSEINLYEDDFLTQLKNTKDVNTFLGNYGFQINSFLNDNIYNNQNFAFDPETQIVTIEYLQYQDGDKKFYEPIQFSLANVTFKLSLKDNPAGIVGIFLAVVIIGGLVSYLIYHEVMKKRMLKAKAAKIIPAWTIQADQKNRYCDVIREQSDLESSIICGIKKPKPTHIYICQEQEIILETPIVENFDFGLEDQSESKPYFDQEDDIILEIPIIENFDFKLENQPETKPSFDQEDEIILETPIEEINDN